MDKSLYLSPFEHEADLAAELAFKGIDVLAQKGRLFLAAGTRADVIWAQVAFLGVQEIPITSINDAAKKLKALGRYWALYSVDLHRRAELIQSELPHYPIKEIAFLQERPTRPMGGWTLWEQNLVLASTHTTSLYPLGEMSFQEDQLNPPSRAYLKLWEFFTCHAPKLPRPGSSVIDMGACPGGWSWVLAEMGCQVTAVDKAPLEERVAKRVQVVQQSAFGLDPATLPKVEWFFSDIICYPARLLELVKRWQQAGVRNFVCTIKYQAETDFVTTQRFLDELGGRIIHQHHNKHEVTWYLLEESP